MTGTSDPDFDARNSAMMQALAEDEELREISLDWLRRSVAYEYSYHFTWLGRPIIQYPQDIVALQEIIWSVRPDVVVETGIARGGSLIFSASMLELIGGDRRRVIGVDVDIREHNRVEIEAHALFHRIEMVEGSSVDPAIVEHVRGRIDPGEQVLVILDSNHTQEHVLRELELYSPLVGAGSYVVVYDTIIELMPAEASSDRAWGPGDNPSTAVRAFLETTDRFEVDATFDRKLALTVAPGGYLRCIR